MAAAALGKRTTAVIWRKRAWCGGADHVAATGTRSVVHGDIGPEKDIQRMTQLMKALYQEKRTHGPGKWSK